MRIKPLITRTIPYTIRHNKKATAVVAASALTLLGITQMTSCVREHDEFVKQARLERRERYTKSLSTTAGIIATAQEILADKDVELKLNPDTEMVELMTKQNVSLNRLDVKILFGLNDGILKKHNDIIHSCYYTPYYRNGNKQDCADVDFQFKTGVKIQFPLSEVGKNLERTKACYQGKSIPILTDSSARKINKTYFYYDLNL